MKRRFAVVVPTTALLAMSVSPASAAEGSRPGPLNGAAAVEALGADIHAFAEQHEMTGEALADLLLFDQDLWVMPEGELLYQDTGLHVDAHEVESANSVPVELEAVDESITFELASDPRATRTIYLDFTGWDPDDFAPYLYAPNGSTWDYSGDGWDSQAAGGFDVDGDPTTFNATEHAIIHEVWARVSEDFAPFHVNVTTKLPGYHDIASHGSEDERYGTIVAISSGTDTFCSCGGVAMLNKFKGKNDNHWPPAWVFTRGTGVNPKHIADAASHEAGHNLNLKHDGDANSPYHRGHNGWAPIMGAGYHAHISQWSRGDYPGATNTQDDFAVAVNAGAPLRADDHGDLPVSGPYLQATATHLELDGAAVRGVIGSAADVDAFEVTLEGGQVSFTVDTAHDGPNLDVRLTLHDGLLPIETADPPSSSGAWSGGMDASMSTDLEAGTYFLLVEGVGRGTTEDGYSDYGSVGHYSIRASSGSGAPIAVATATPSTGVAPLQTALDGTASTDPDVGDTLTYAWDLGDGSAPQEGAVVEHSYAEGTWTATLTVTDQTGLQSTDSVVITVEQRPDPDPEPPGPTGAPDVVVSGSSVELSWNEGQDALSYTIEREEQHSNGTWRNLTALASTPNTFWTDAPGGGTFRYRIVATNTVGANTSPWTQVTVSGGGGKGKKGRGS